MSCESERAEVESAQNQVISLQIECASLSSDSSLHSRCMNNLSQAENRLRLAQILLANCEGRDGSQPVTPNITVLSAEGLLTFLRVHDLYTGYGPENDKILGECVFKLHAEPGKAFGFALRDDKYYPARQQMFSLLKDAFFHGLETKIDYFEELGSNKQNHTAFRVELLKVAPPEPLSPSDGPVLTT